MKKTTIYDVIIIGSGPAGMTAAVYASRANMSTLLLDKGIPGGQLQNTEEIENFPGFSHISGPKLAEEMFEHSTKFGAQYKNAEVKNIKKEGIYFHVTTGKDTFKSLSVIVATGTKYKKLGIPGEEEFSGRGVSWCAVCDGAFFKEKELIVVGGGDSAVEEAVYLTKFASKVTVVHRRDTFRAQPILVERMLKNKKIEVIYNSVVEEITGEDGLVSGVVIKNVNNNETTNIACDGVFEYVGMDPISEFVKDLDITTEDGWIITDEDMSTRIPGLFASGDIRHNTVRQVVTATGDGCKAALSAQHYIEVIK